MLARSDAKPSSNWRVTCFGRRYLLWPTSLPASEPALCAPWGSTLRQGGRKSLLRGMIGLCMSRGRRSTGGWPRGAPSTRTCPPARLRNLPVESECRGPGGLVTLSPHYRAHRLMSRRDGPRRLVSLGHTAPRQSNHGGGGCRARLSSILGNGAASMLPRHPNFIWSQLCDDR